VCGAGVYGGAPLEHLPGCEATIPPVMPPTFAEGGDDEFWLGRAHVRLGRAVALMRRSNRPPDRWKDGRWGQAALEKATLGVLGEMAVSFRLGIPYPAYVNRWHAPDLDPDHEVKTTFHRTGRLYVPDDRDSPVQEGWRYWLALVVPETDRAWCRVPGWLSGHELRSLPLIDPDGNRPCRRQIQDLLHHWTLGAHVEDDYPRSAWDASTY